MSNTDDRDTPRFGRPADFPTDSADLTGELTPPPQQIPPMTERSLERAKAATRDPSIPDSVRASLGETFRQVEILRAATTEAIDALRALHPVRKAPDQLGELATRIERLEKRPDALADDIDDLTERVIDMSGRSGDNGKLGALAARVDRNEGVMNAHIDKTTTTLDDLKGFKNRLGGVAIVGSFFGSIVGAVLIYLITKNL